MLVQHFSAGNRQKRFQQIEFFQRLARGQPVGVDRGQFVSQSVRLYRNLRLWQRVRRSGKQRQRLNLRATTAALLQTRFSRKPNARTGAASGFFLGRLLALASS